MYVCSLSLVVNGGSRRMYMRGVIAYAIHGQPGNTKRQHRNRTRKQRRCKMHCTAAYGGVSIPAVGAPANCLGRGGRGSLRLSRVRPAAQLSVCDAASKIPKAPTAKIVLLPSVTPHLQPLPPSSEIATRPAACRPNYRYVLLPHHLPPNLPVFTCRLPVARLQINHLTHAPGCA